MGLRSLLVAAGLVVLLALPLEASATETIQVALGTPLGVVPSTGHPASTTGTSGTSNLLYHNGPVMRTNTTYAIYWFPSGSTYDAAYQGTINGFLQNVASASGATSNVYASDTQYSDGTGAIASSSTYAGSYVDHTAFPSSGCHDLTGHVCLTNAQLVTEIQAAVRAAGWTPGPNKLFFLMTPKNVDSCFDSGSTTCAFTSYCAYHSWSGSGSSVLLFANMPYADTVPGACDWGQHPNGGETDATINVLSHEHNEAITDPQGTGWWDASGEENGDKCAWNFGTPLGSTGTGQYNQAIGSGRYWLQQEWSNSGTHCVLTFGGPAAPTVTSLSPGQGVVGTSVTLNGTGFTGATSVKFNGTSATTFSVTSATQLTATVPAGATTGTVSVTTAAGTGTSSSSFTVIPAPTISSLSLAGGTVGTSVTISGTGFTGATAVRFNGTAAATFSVTSSTSITATVAPGTTAGTMQVTTPGGTATSSATFRILRVTGLSPASGRAGTVVTITGTGFTGATVVKFNATNASYTILSDTQIRATVPAGATTGLVAVTTSLGTARSGTSFTVTP